MLKNVATAARENHDEQQYQNSKSLPLIELPWLGTQDVLRHLGC
jgi:hypothetical protein